MGCSRSYFVPKRLLTDLGAVLREELVIAISMTRVVFELITRVQSRLSSTSHPTLLTYPPSQINKLYSDSHPRPNPWVKTPDSISIEPHWIAQAQNLMIELTELRAKRTRGFIDMNNNPEAIDVHKRVLLGDLIWCHSLEVSPAVNCLMRPLLIQSWKRTTRSSSGSTSSRNRLPIKRSIN